jgi:hypothetical protein
MELKLLTLSEAIDNVKPIVVQISFMASNLSLELKTSTKKPFIHLALGTGFFVNDEGYIVTAKHVIDGFAKVSEQINAGIKRIGVGLAIPNTKNMRGNFAVVDFEIIAMDSFHDIALLRILKNPFRGEVKSGFVINEKEVPLLFGVPTLNLNRPKDGTLIAISGYPLNNPVLVTNSGGLATCWETIVKEAPIPNAPVGFMMPQISDVYLADIEVNSGDSGAPVYDIESSTIIGLCVASELAQVLCDGKPATLEGKSLCYSSGLTIVIPTEYIAKLLDENKISYKRIANIEV